MSSGCELWIGCVRWLRDLNLLPDKNSTLTELAAILRDGVLLCRLANALIPNSVDQNKIIKSLQQSQFTCFNNIDNFVDVCRNQFNMAENDLFAAGDLFHMTGFQKILKTLSILSNSEQSIAKDVNPFPEVDRCLQGASSSQDFVDDTDIYQSLYDDIESISLKQTIYGPIISTDPDVQESEKLYDRIITTRKSSMNKNDNSPAVNRIKCIQELYDTEKNYTEMALVTITKVFYEPLKRILRPDDLEVIFANIEEINELHKALLADLKYPVEVAIGIQEKVPRPTSLEDCPPQTIGEVFVKYRDQFLAYGKYCSNLTDSRKLSNALLKSDSSIAQAIENMTREGNCKFGMNDLLCVPFQRITKYPLLLKELVKKTDVTSPDRSSIQEAMDVMEDVCAYINEESRDTNSKKVIDEIEQSITDLAMPPNVKLHDYGRVNHDGEIKMAESTISTIGKPKQRYIFLFDKVIVVCKAASRVTTKDKSPGAKANNFTYKTAYIMSELSIDQNVSIDAKAGGTITRRTQYVIHMHRDRTDGNEIVQLTFYFKNEASRTNWMKALLLSKSNVCPTKALCDSNHKPSFTSFRVDINKPTICGVCLKLMKGLRYQGYKCEVCRMEMHKECLGLRQCDISTTQRSTHEPRHFEGDRVEVIQMQSHNRFTGRMDNSSNCTGLVNVFPLNSVPNSSGCELWMGCVRWLRDLNLLPDKNSTLTELAAVLRDGVLLCRLANALIPNSVDQNKIIKSSQQSQFTCFNNIDNFVDVCRNQFNMAENDLFAAGDLFHMTGFQKILKTLSILSNSEQSIAKDVNPFPEVDRSLQGASSSRDFIDDTDICQSHHNDIESITLNQTIHGPIISTDHDVQESEKLYDRIITTRKSSMNENDTHSIIGLSPVESSPAELIASPLIVRNESTVLPKRPDIISSDPMVEVILRLRGEKEDRLFSNIFVERRISQNGLKQKIATVTHIPPEFQKIQLRGKHLLIACPLETINSFEELVVQHTEMPRWNSYKEYVNSVLKSCPNKQEIARKAVQLYQQLKESKFFDCYLEFDNYCNRKHSKIAAWTDGDVHLIQKATELFFRLLHDQKRSGQFSKFVCTFENRSRELGGRLTSTLAHVQIHGEDLVSRYYIKCHHNGPKGTNAGQPLDIAELYCYKVLELIGVGPQCHFIPPATTTGTKTSTYIATKWNENFELMKNVISSGTLSVAIVVQLVVLRVLFFISDLHGENCGVWKGTENAAIVDFAPAEKVQVHSDIKRELFSTFPHQKWKNHFLALKKECDDNTWLNIAKEYLEKWDLKKNIQLSLEILNPTKSALKNVQLNFKKRSCRDSPTDQLNVFIDILQANLKNLQNVLSDK